MTRHFWAFVAVLALGACVQLPDGGPGARIYRLSPPPALDEVDPGVRGVRIHVARPTSAPALDGDRIVVAVRPNELAYLGEALWAAPPTRLLRTAVADTFERSGLVAEVATGENGANEDYALFLTLREFAAREDAGALTAEVRVAARLVSRRARTLIAAELFEERARASNDGPDAVADAFDEAVSALVTDVVSWTTEEAARDAQGG